MSEPTNIQLAGWYIRQVGSLFLAIVIISFISLIGYLFPTDISVSNTILMLAALISFSLIILSAALLISAGKHLERKE